jgi:hypothetical protein
MQQQAHYNNTRLIDMNNMRNQTAGEYKVILEDGSSQTFIADNKTDARKQMNKYLRDLCGFGGRYGGKLPTIQEIEKCS